MKHTQKLFALLLALTLVLSLAATAFAAETGQPYTITINGVPGEHTLNAYQIFKGDQTDTGNPEQLVNIQWGNGVNSTNLLTALAGEATFKTGNDPWFNTNMEARDVADVLGDQQKFSSNSPALLKFTELVKANKATAISLTKGSETTGKVTYTATVSERGYYVVIDECTSGHELVTGPVAMMEVVGDFTVNFKGDALDLTKDMTKIENVQLTGEASNHKDVEVGDTITYTLKSKVPYLSADYQDYKFTITDTMSKGLTFMGESTVNVTVGNTSLTKCASNCGNNHSTDKNVYHLTVDTTDSEGNTIITIDFPEMLSYGQNATGNSPKAGDEITVTYQAKVNADALTVDVETNSAVLTFSKNTTGDQDGKTTEKKTFVSEIDLQILKTDGEEAPTKLSGAEFVLYQVEGTTGEGAQKTIKFYKATDNVTDITWATVANAVTETDSQSGLPTEWDNSKLDGTTCTVVKTDAQGLAKFQGLDAGTYYLHEVKAPNGYNALLGDIQVDLSVTWSEDNASGNKVPTWTVKYTNLWETKPQAADGKVTGGSGSQFVGEMTVVNKAGTELPSTGGIGTTIFYIAGAALALTAVILLVTKKRMTR